MSGQWATNEVCKQMESMNFQMEYLEGFQWTKKTRLIDPWAKLLWDTRRALKEDRTRYPNAAAADVAYQMIKFIATRAVGWLDLGKEKEKPYGQRDQWNRPDIANGIIGLARARMFLKMQEIFTAQKATPIGVRTDMLIYCSNELDPRKAFPKLVVREQELGGFKVVGTLKMNQSIINQMANGDSHLYKLNVLKAMLNGGKVKVR
jgi:hypothetical protein